MLANAELAQDFNRLNQQHKELVSALLDLVNIPPVRVEVEATPEGNFRGFDGGKFYLVDSGSISARYRGRTVYFLEEGDMLLPDIAGLGNRDIAVFYGSEAGASLYSYPALEFMQRVFSDPAAIKLWTRLLITYAGMMLRLTAARTHEDSQATPGFEMFEAGEIIIRQGERADYVFNLSSGSAEVLVDDVIVGRIGEGEIFGAMAALTHADRSATVRAETPCAVVKVPKEQFTDLIKSNPATIHSLLIDMANSIVNLNEQLVGLRSNTRKPQI
ncbi:cyclic nucleotide-binding domain-containing protein [Parahaliea maris]|uniref:Cyclic nucleotide-binding domain-containing protein n=1 Tax=Parahaliea maris TaxID=2716870 RepID=A0A5C9A281_9GAMM|nr:cyclic nucleotide-binding domain-containing protein [Parahaliea maris]TXS93880.1 cyclic nucleotide-binding domain-containing protein [Parahaliea maris]